MIRSLTPLLRALLLVAVLATSGLPSLAAAQGLTAEQGNAILEELKLIRQLLEKQAAALAPGGAPVDDKVSLSFAPGGYVLGREDAPLTMIEYTDYQCPFCQQFHNTTWVDLKRNYIDTGKLRFVSRDFPLDFHENARRAAVAARCAGEQGRFWELRHAMIVHADQLQAEKLIGYARDVGLDITRFSTCVLADKYKAEIDKSYAEGLAAGVSGTPSFILGRVERDRIEGVRIVGALPYPAFDAKIRELLEPAGK